MIAEILVPSSIGEEVLHIPTSRIYVEGEEVDIDDDEVERISYDYNERFFIEECED